MDRRRCVSLSDRASIIAIIAMLLTIVGCAHTIESRATVGWCLGWCLVAEETTKTESDNESLIDGIANDNPTSLGRLLGEE